jgi:hypothetical protein
VTPSRRAIDDDENAMGEQTLEDRGPTVFVVTLILIILATVFVILRLISKWGVTRKANADDYCTIVAWLFALAPRTRVSLPPSTVSRVIVGPPIGCQRGMGGGIWC